MLYLTAHSPQYDQPRSVANAKSTIETDTKSPEYSEKRGLKLSITTIADVISSVIFPFVSITSAVMVQHTMVSAKTSKIPHIPCI
jgi:hypothetical protein